MDQWRQLLEERASSSNTKPITDPLAVDLFAHLRNNCAVTFRDAKCEDVLDFVTLAYPVTELRRLTAEGQVSEFLAALHADWKPAFVDWVTLLWRFSGKAHEFFGDILYLMPGEQLSKKTEMGRVLFRDMLENDEYSELTVVSIAGALIKWPQEATMAIVHAKEILTLCQHLSPEETGMVCRSLLMYRATRNCTCGYECGREYCACKEESAWSREAPKKGMHLEGDLDKDYACALFRVVVADHAEGRATFERLWDEKQTDAFVRSASEFVFSELVYVEIFQNVMLSGREPPTQEHPRQLTTREKCKGKENPRSPREYDRDTAQHAGCVERVCRQHYKYGCENVSCGQHCKSKGRRTCNTHRFYSPKWPPAYRAREHVQGVKGVWITNVAP